MSTQQSHRIDKQQECGLGVSSNKITKIIVTLHQSKVKAGLGETVAKVSVGFVSVDKNNARTQNKYLAPLSSSNNKKPSHLFLHFSCPNTIHTYYFDRHCFRPVSLLPRTNAVRIQLNTIWLLHAPAIIDINLFPTNGGSSRRISTVLCGNCMCGVV